MFSFIFSNPIASLLRFGYILFIKLSYELLGKKGVPNLRMLSVHMKSPLSWCCSNCLALRSSHRGNKNSVLSVQIQRLFQGPKQHYLHSECHEVALENNSASSVHYLLYRRVYVYIRETRYETNGASHSIISIFPSPLGSINRHIHNTCFTKKQEHA